jgi:hypothetical protein
VAQSQGLGNGCFGFRARSGGFWIEAPGRRGCTCVADCAVTCVRLPPLAGRRRAACRCGSLRVYVAV